MSINAINSEKNQIKKLVYDLNTVAEMTSTKPSSIRKAVAYGYLKPVERLYPNSRYMFRYEAIEEWINSGMPIKGQF